MNQHYKVAWLTLSPCHRGDSLTLILLVCIGMNMMIGHTGGRGGQWEAVEHCPFYQQVRHIQTCLPIVHLLEMFSRSVDHLSRHVAATV